MYKYAHERKMTPETSSLVELGLVGSEKVKVKRKPTPRVISSHFRSFHTPRASRQIMNRHDKALQASNQLTNTSEHRNHVIGICIWRNNRCPH
jgi:hypothetical protein